MSEKSLYGAPERCQENSPACCQRVPNKAMLKSTRSSPNYQSGREAIFRKPDLAGLGSLYIGWEHHFGAETRGPGSSFTTIRLTLNFALKVAVCPGVKSNLPTIRREGGGRDQNIVNKPDGSSAENEPLASAVSVRSCLIPTLVVNPTVARKSTRLPSCGIVPYRTPGVVTL